MIAQLEPGQKTISVARGADRAPHRVPTHLHLEAVLHHSLQATHRRAHHDHLRQLHLHRHHHRSNPAHARKIDQP